MRPGNLHLLETLDSALGDHIAPRIHDAHLQARIVVMRQIIGHLHQRARLEGQYLWDENAELVGLLGDLAKDFPQIDVTGALAAADEVVPAGAYPALPLLEERNRILRTCLVEVITANATRDEGPRSVANARINTHLRAQLDREDQLCTVPVFGSGSAESRDLSLV